MTRSREKPNNKHWSDEKSLLLQLQKMWDKGQILRETVCDSGLFPKRLSFNKPDSKTISNDFDAVRNWVSHIQKIKTFRIIYKTIRHQVIGANRIPGEAWIDTLESAVFLLKKQQQLAAYRAIVKQTEEKIPEIIPWLRQYPHKVLDLADVWPKLLEFISWRKQHPDPELYLRQISLPGIDSKLIEQHRSVLAALLDMVLPETQIDSNARGVKQFEQRYGFRHKPARIRFRLLDDKFPSLSTIMPITVTGSDYDYTITARDFQGLQKNTAFTSRIKRIFITENEINFLTFPAQINSMVIFGSGYGFDALAKAQWLAQKKIYYWGDIDTHGFAILDQLRSKFPQTNSMLMNVTTLMKHKEFWGRESKPQARKLCHLTDAEQDLYQALVSNQFACAVRLEQERIDFTHLSDSIKQLSQ